MTPACPRHRTLVDRALSDDATAADLERYAVEVPDCAECRRLLAVDLQVHPVVLDRGGQGGWDALSDHLAPTDGERELLSLVQHRPRTWLRWAAPAALIAAALSVVVLSSPVAPPSTPAPPPELPIAAAPMPAVAAPPVVATPSPPPAAEEVPVVAAAPSELPAPAPTSPPPVVARAADWAPPAFVNLVGTRPKALGSPTRSIRLELDGAPAEGGSVYLAVATTTEERLAVCVDGPERGVVWRGDVPPGAVDLGKDGHRQAFRFGAAGVYTFAVSTTDYVECTDPVHVVEVEVR